MRPFTHTLASTAIIAAAALFATGCGSKQFTLSEDNHDLPEPRREFRAAWVATVANIDWPSEPGLPVDQQRKEAITILDRAAELNMNAIIFQVRPGADALYESQYEPWSYYLTGKQGEAPSPFYDPLEFWIDEAHDRGIELHAWFNPYRALHPIQAKNKFISETSIVKTRPDLAKPLAPSKVPNTFYWMDPGEPEVQAISQRVMLDVATRYNVDGIHIDDYFYPYDSYYDEGGDFPDDESFGRYVASGGTLDRGDWRRKNVNDFIHNFYTALREETKDVQFGISPFGIWRPGHPESIQGLDQYDKLYADAKLWLNEGWLDYWTPQLYWPIAQTPQSYTTLLKWWVEENTKNRNVWPGNGFHNVPSGKENWGVQEALDQVQATRDQPGATGNVIFSMIHFMPGHKSDDLGLAKALVEGPWAKKALVPRSPWLDDEAPAAPVLTYENGIASVSKGDDEAPFQYVTYALVDGEWKYEIVPAAKPSFPAGKATCYAAKAVDRRGNTSDAVFITP